MTLGRRLLQSSDLALAACLLLVTATLVVPLPTALVDVLLVANLALSVVVLLATAYVTDPLQLSVFPSLLLTAALGRLGLNVAMARLILTQGSAGSVVAAFGGLVVGGNLVVGLVLFVILLVVQFLVVTNGTSRMAEVAARFALDAMPGKQMSIDSDLRANLISVSEARNRRAELNKESQLFGAMDGAMKFVNGDAIASLIIIAINMIGGMAIGVAQMGMSAGDALQVYTILTIGDGLVSQIPALMISVTAGIVITRVPNEQKQQTNIGREIAEQLTSQPKAWIIASVAMLGFAALPGMPTLTFIIIAIICGCGGLLQLQRARTSSALEEDPEVIPPEMNGQEDLRTFSPSRQFVLQFHPSQDAHQVAALLSEIRQRRNRLVVQYGLTLPSFIIEQSPLLPPDEFRFSVYEVPLFKATLTQSQLAVPARSLPQGAVCGSNERQEEDWVWMPADDPMLQNDELEIVSAATLIVERMERAMQACGPQFIGLQETKAILGWLESEQPELAQEMQRVLPLARFSAILQRLAAECVPLRSVRLIAETLIEHAQHERDVTVLTDYVRIALKSQIYHQYSSVEGLLVWLLTPESEGILRDGLRQTQTETFFALNHETSQLLLQQLHMAFPMRAPEQAVLLVPQDLRSPLRTLLQEEFHHVPVLSFAEISSAARIKVMGRFDLEESVALDNDYAA